MNASEFRSLGHATVDLLADYFDSIEDQPLFPDVTPGALAELFDEPLPVEGTTGEALLQRLQRELLPNCTHVNHPGYFGLMTPSPTAMGILGDFIASALNQNVGTYTIGPAATAIERRTIRWLTELIGFGDQAGGNLTSGGMLANLIGLKLGRDWTSRDRVQKGGVRHPWVVYTSEERHVSVDKAVDVVGLGRENLRTLPTEDDFRLSIDALEKAIAADKARGLLPMAVVAIAGTTNTGAVDPLETVRTICDRENIWMHVDAAYGGAMLLSDRSRKLLAGLERADSVTLDPHKWFYAPLDAGAILVREEDRLTRSFGLQPAYLTDESDTENERYQYYVHGLEQSRRFRSLKVWLAFQRYGTKELGRWIDANIEQAQLLAGLCETVDDLAPLVAPQTSAVCLRFDPGGVEEERLGLVHQRVARRIEEEGDFWISTTVLKGRWAYRINPINLRTTPDHMRALFTSIHEKSRAVHEELG